MKELRNSILQFGKGSYPCKVKINTSRSRICSAKCDRSNMGENQLKIVEIDFANRSEKNYDKIIGKRV